MKRQTALALAAVFSLSVAGTALAAPANPFVDVPAKHWAYDTVSKLAQAGVITGYGDGTFRGDRTLTRYEMAVIIGKAMASNTKMDAETQKALESLKSEFSAELTNLGVRLDTLEKNSSKIKFTGEVRERYDYQDKMVNWDEDKQTDGSDNLLQTRLRLNMEAQVAKDVTFHGRYQAESEWGSSAEAKLTQAYITGKAAGLDYSFGRQPIVLGQGLIADLTGNCDGLLLTAGKDVKVTAGAFKVSAVSAYLAPISEFSLDRNFFAANVDAKISDNLNLSVSYLKDKEQNNIIDPDGDPFDLSPYGYDGIGAYKTTSVGLNYTGIKNFTVSGEYAQNDSDVAKIVHNGDEAKAWMGKIKYAGAKRDKVGSLGVWVGYRDADFGFDPASLTTLDAAALDGTFSYADNVKGAEFGVEYTVFKNGVLNLQYNDHELKETLPGIDKDKKNFFAELIYKF